MVVLGPLSPACLHLDAVPVAALDGERVAWLCPNCDKQLPPEWKPSITDMFFDPRLIREGRSR